MKNLIKGKEREGHYSRKTLECKRKITISKELVSVRQITCKTTRFLGLSPTPVFIQKHFLMGPSNKIFGEESFDFAILNPPIKIIRIMFNHVNFLYLL